MYPPLYVMHHYGNNEEYQGRIQEYPNGGGGGSGGRTIDKISPTPSGGAKIRGDGSSVF